MEENFVRFGMGKTKEGDEQAICKCNVKCLGHDFAVLQVLKKPLETGEKKILLLIDFAHCFLDASVWSTNSPAENLLCFCFLGALINKPKSCLYKGWLQPCSLFLGFFSC